MIDTCQAQYSSCYSGLSCPLPCSSCQRIIFLDKSEIFVQLFRTGDHFWSGRSSHGFRLGARDHRFHNGDQQQATEETSCAHLRLHFKWPEVAVSVVLQKYNGVHVHEAQIAKETTWLWISHMWSSTTQRKRERERETAEERFPFSAALSLLLIRRVHQRNIFESFLT